MTLPSDPFTGRALLYRKNAESYAVYSLGESDRDGGGEGLNKEKHGNVGVCIRLSPASQPSQTQP